MVRAPLVVAWLCLGAIAGGAGWLLRAPDDAATSRDEAAHQMPAVRRPAHPFARWTITEHFVAHHVLVVQVETRHVAEAQTIARRIVPRLQDRYSEVMIYFHRPARPDTLPPRRVQWTRAAGYVETDFEQR